MIGVGEATESLGAAVAGGGEPKVDAGILWENSMHF